ncbi:hypothetical protein [Dyadobacter sp. CY347]|uniref:hypothetical protein n=1 Tax=Dyadobacter sp. CY347 TaxID=2909336 RepID=UPI001F1FA1F5|nr:hypothetical protein [Dyadobacter sp. CY347]MCF2487496.1 hypothetical protein [Dyadobacter sp. CY347]
MQNKPAGKMNNELLLLLANIGAWAFGVLALTCVFGIFYFGKQLEIERDAKTAMSGVLKSVESKPPKVLLQDGKLGSNAVLKVGNSLTYFQKTTSGPIFEIDNTPLTIALINDSIAVSVDINDSNGDLVARLVENEWQINANKIFDRNYTKSKLEIIDVQGEVVFQAALLGDTVQLQCKLFGRNKTGFGMYSDETNRGVFAFANPNRPFEFSIKPIFKYPSEKNLGKQI